MYIFGIHGDFGKSGHDAAAALLKDGEIVAAAEEERFLRYKHAVGVMPTAAIVYCLKEAGIAMKDVDLVAFPRETWRDFVPRFEAYLWYNFGHVPPIQYINHHLAHAASAYHVSGFPRSLVITLDQAGDGVAGAVFKGEDGKLTQESATVFPHSLGLFAAFITQYLGFRSNHDEYKVMGLASYGKPSIDLSHLISFSDGELTFDDSALHSLTFLRHPLFSTNQIPMMKDESCPGLPPRRLPGGKLLEEHKDLAASAQKLIEEIILAYVAHHHADEEYLCFAGGVAENSVANGRLAMSGQFKDIYIPSAANDAGTALGAALQAASERGVAFERMNDNKLGPSYSDEEIEELLASCKVPFTKSTDIAGEIAELLKQQNIIAWFQGRMEYGPRALGSRSLIADPSNEAMRVRVNRIKRREQFRPFAPSVLEEHAGILFPKAQTSPFMSFTLPATEEGKKKIIGATHVDFTGRLQTVPPEGGIYRRLIESFYEKTGIPAVLNTSLNSSWEPIVESPAQALAFFFSSEADVLALGNYVIQKPPRV